MNSAKYFLTQTNFAILDLNSKIEEKGMDFIKNLKLNSEFKKLTHESLFLYEFNDKGNFIEFKNSINIDETFFISEFPQLIYPNWLIPFIYSSEPIIISQFIEPLDPKKALEGLRNRIVNLTAQYYDKANKGQVNLTQIQQAIEDAKDVEERITRGVEKLYSMSMYLKINSNDIKDLQKRKRELQISAVMRGIKLYSMAYRQKEGLEVFLPSSIDKANNKFSLTSSNVSSSLTFTTASLNDSDGIFYGLSNGGTRVRFDRFKGANNYNGIIFANSGAGKSFAAKLEAYRSLFRGINVYVIDPEGEFKGLCDYVGGTNIDVNPESKIKLNPFQFFSKETDSKEIMRSHLGVVKGLLKIWLSEKTYDRGIVSEAVNKAYENKDIILEDPTTYLNDAPRVSDLVKVFEEMGEDGKKIARELIQYTKKGELGDLYDNPTSESVDFDSHMVVFNIQRVPESEKQAIVFLLSNFIWQKVLNTREQKKLLIIDEAHLLLKEESSANFIEELARRARKYNLGVIFISQDVDDFLNNPQGNIISKQAETALILSQKKQSIPSITKAFDLSEFEQDLLINLQKGQGIFIKGSIHSQISIWPTPHETKIFSSNPEDLIKLDLLRKNEQQN